MWPAVRHGDRVTILFTNEVFSFVSGAGARIARLREMRGWLRRRGVVFLSARWVARACERWMLGLPWVGHRPRGGRESGASHTRYIGSDGQLRRSFIQLFTVGRVAREAARAGFAAGPRRHGHVELTSCSES